MRNRNVGSSASFVTALVLLTLSATAETKADSFYWGSRQVVNSDFLTDGDYDGKPRICTNNDGEWVCTWSRTTEEPYLFFAKSNNNGLNWSAPTTMLAWPEVYAGTAARIQDKDIKFSRNSAGQDPKYVVAWQSALYPSGTPGGPAAVYVSTSSDGMSWGGAVQLDDTRYWNLRTNSWPRLGTDGKGRWLVAWDQFRPDGHHYLMCRKSVDNALTWSTQQPIPHAGSDLNAGNQMWSDIAAFARPDGSSLFWIVSHVSLDSAVPDCHGILGLQAVSFNSTVFSGGAWSTWSPTPQYFRMNQPGGKDGYWNNPHPKIDATSISSGNKFVAVWRDHLSDQNCVDTDAIYFSKSENGGGWTMPQPIRPFNEWSPTAMHPEISCDLSDNWIAVWQTGYGMKTSYLYAGEQTWTPAVNYGYALPTLFDGTTNFPDVCAQKSTGGANAGWLSLFSYNDSSVVPQYSDGEIFSVYTQTPER